MGNIDLPNGLNNKNTYIDNTLQIKDYIELFSKEIPDDNSTNNMLLLVILIIFIIIFLLDSHI